MINTIPYLKVVQDLSVRRKKKIYLVGGFLRDVILGREKFDYDFAVEKDALKIAREFSRQIKGAYVLLDKEHGCARIAKKEQGRILTFDFADFRAKTIEKDLQRRDFTVNTLAVDVLADKILIDKNNAQKDLDKKIVRMVSAKAFQEDPLRLMRAFALRAVFDFTIEAKTLKQIRKDADLLRGVSYERVRDELFKVLESDLAARTLREMDEVGLLERVIPQIRIMYNCHQGGYHHLDVWFHSLEVVTQLEKVFDDLGRSPDVKNYIEEKISGERTRKALLKLAALLHDVGKPQTKKKEKDRLTFHGHEHVGRGISRIVAKNLKLSTQERFILEDVVVHHLRPGYLSNFKRPSEKSVYRYFRDTKDNAAGIALLSLADQRSTRGPLTSAADQRHHEKICLSLLKQYFDDKNKKPFIRLINGNDLIKKLKLKPSVLFGEILGKVEEAQNLGKISTKEEALTLAKEIAYRKNKK